MRAVIACLLLVVTAASAETKRKTKPDKFEAAAGDAFARAMAAEDKGDLKGAIDLYKKSLKISPHPNTIFNIAELEARVGSLSTAVRTYEAYLVLAPAAKDRKQIVALIAELETRPATVEITSDPDDSKGIDLTTAYVLVDGAIVRRPGAKNATTVKLAPRSHRIDVVTPVTSVSYELDLAWEGGRTVTHKVTTRSPRTNGNVLVSGDDLMVRFRGAEFRPWGNRLVVPPGQYRMGAIDRNFECPPFSVDVPKAPDAVAYVHLAPVELLNLPIGNGFPPRCRSLAVTQQILTFSLPQ